MTIDWIGLVLSVAILGCLGSVAYLDLKAEKENERRFIGVICRDKLTQARLVIMAVRHHTGQLIARDEMGQTKAYAYAELSFSP